MKEWMDIYDCQGRVKGLIHTTTQGPKDGNYYLANRVWVQDSAGRLLLLQPVAGGQWKTAGDFVPAGIQGLEAARQALVTETGLTPAEPQWQSLGTQRYRDIRGGIPYHAIAQLYLVQLTESAPELDKLEAPYQWVSGDAMADFLREQELDAFTRLSFEQYTARILL